MPPDDGRDGAVEQGPFRLPDALAAVHAETRVDAALDRLLDETGRLTRSSSAGVSLLHPDGDRYTKVAERGVPCGVGSSFPLEEGVTGRAVAARRPVVLDDYARLRFGHLDGRRRAAHRSVAAVPVWWRGEVVAVEVAFRPPGAGFSAADVDLLETLAQSAAPVLARRREVDPSLGGLLRRRIAEAGTATAASITETGTARSVGAGIADAAADLLLALGRGAADASGEPLRVAVVYAADRVRLLAQQGGPDRSWVLPALPASPGIGVRFEQVPGWGLVLQADLPYAGPTAEREPDPLTRREHEVLTLVRHGRTDRQVAAALTLSPKTVEKHVGALLRKTGAASRAAAVATAIERGWLQPG